MGVTGEHSAFNHSLNHFCKFFLVFLDVEVLCVLVPLVSLTNTINPLFVQSGFYYQFFVAGFFWFLKFYFEEDSIFNYVLFLKHLLHFKPYCFLL